MESLKAQSAMEYLMTYGWAILIIAIVLAALFSLGIFSSNSFTGTTCVASSGFLCSSPVWTNGNFIVNLGQSTGTSWSNVMFFFVPVGISNPTSSLTAPSTPNSLISVPPGNYIVGYSSAINANPVAPSLPDGKVVSFTFDMAEDGYPTSVGTSATGTLWVQYNTPSVGGLLSQIATINIRES